MYIRIGYHVMIERHMIGFLVFVFDFTYDATEEIFENSFAARPPGSVSTGFEGSICLSVRPNEIRGFLFNIALSDRAPCKVLLPSRSS